MEVRDYTQREIDSREALVNALREDVVNKLAALRDTQTRIRNRIREDLKTATEVSRGRVWRGENAKLRGCQEIVKNKRCRGSTAQT